MSRASTIILGLLFAIIMTATGFAAMPGTWVGGGSPTAGVDLDVHSGGLSFEVSFNGGPWVPATPNIAGQAGDVWNAPETDVNGGKVRVHEGNMQFKRDGSSTWTNMRRRRNSETGTGENTGSTVGKPPFSGGGGTVGTLPHS